MAQANPIGIAAWRHDWLARLSWKQARPWIITFVISWFSLPVGIALAEHSNGPGKSDRNCRVASRLACPAELETGPPLDHHLCHILVLPPGGHCTRRTLQWPRQIRSELPRGVTTGLPG